MKVHVSEQVERLPYVWPVVEASVARLGVTAGRLFPGFGGAAESVRDYHHAFGEDIEW